MAHVLVGVVGQDGGKVVIFFLCQSPQSKQVSVKPLTCSRSNQQEYFGERSKQFSISRVFLCVLKITYTLHMCEAKVRPTHGSVSCEVKVFVCSCDNGSHHVTD